MKVDLSHKDTTSPGRVVELVDVSAIDVMTPSRRQRYEFFRSVNELSEEKRKEMGLPPLAGLRRKSLPQDKNAATENAAAAPESESESSSGWVDPYAAAEKRKLEHKERFLEKLQEAPTWFPM